MEKNEIRKEALSREAKNIIIIQIGGEKESSPSEEKSDNPNSTKYYKPTDKRHEQKLEKTNEKVQYDDSTKKEERCLKCVSYINPESVDDSPMCIKVSGNIRKDGICKLFQMRREIPYAEMKPVRL